MISALLLNFLFNSLDAFADFLAFFTGNVKRKSLTPKLARNLKSYQLTALSPLALIVYAAPVALMIDSSWKHLVRVVVPFTDKVLISIYSPFASCRALS